MAETEAASAGWRGEMLDWAKTLAGAFLAYVAFTTVAFAQYEIPSESMVPHLEVGDRVTVSKFAYGYSRHSLPFEAGRLLPANAQRLLGGLPRRGDVVVFIHPRSGETMIKRLIGLPGDMIEVRAGALFINGEAAAVSQPELLLRRAHPGVREWTQRAEEQLPGGAAHAVHSLTAAGDFDTFGPYRVPADHLFFMGDNRDNSLDSRWDGMGPVPVENLIGRAEIVYATRIDPCARDASFACSMPRWLRPLHH
ncbi:MAG TPA: signal peptidase I [Vitreimonas sp.]|uniref:signal peptidase I n=1 Tax=Vitreimonas sp. TaxID=3069702 RepID=UPI002D2AA70C|nr:signal peptidase I [Vitreimonas sp.]HYD87031.1 signal peptidase I [Vitreimonas sp.]